MRFACRVTTGSSRTVELPIWDGLLVRSLPSHALLLHPVRHGKIMIEHLTFLAARHLEARFIWVDAENAPFLTDKLNIWMLPTIVCLKDNKVCASRAPGQWPLRVGGPPTKGEARRPRRLRVAAARWRSACENSCACGMVMTNRLLLGVPSAPLFRWFRSRKLAGPAKPLAPVLAGSSFRPLLRT